MSPQQSGYVRVSYVIPPPATVPPRLLLPPLGANRHGSIRPLLIYAPASPKNSTCQSETGWRALGSNPRHRLGISSLAIDTCTQLQGSEYPQGILYSGGRDGQIVSWDLWLKTSRRQRFHGHEHDLPYRRSRWEILTGWSDAMDEEDEEDEEIVGSDGDVLGDVVDPVSQKRRASEGPSSPLPEGAWELDSDNYSSVPSTMRQCIQTHTDWINDILLCNVNRTVVSASSDGTIRAWSPHLAYNVDPTLLGLHDDYVRCLTASPHQPWIASGSFDRTIKLWDLSRTIPPSNDTVGWQTSSKPDPLITLSLPSPSQKASVYAIATDQLGSVLASGSPERVVRLWDPRSGKRTGKLVGHTDNIRAIVLSDDGKYVLTGSADASIKLWSLASQRCLHTFTHHADSVWSLSSQHPSLEVFYSGDRTGIVTRVDVEGCNSIDEGECVVLCNATRADAGYGTSSLDNIFRLPDSIGVNNLVTMDDRLLWTATGSSSIKRWKIPPRRSSRITSPHSFAPGSPIKVPYHVGFSPGKRESGSSDLYTSRRGLSHMAESPRRHLDDIVPRSSPGSPRSGSPHTSTHRDSKHLSVSSNQVIPPVEPTSSEETTLHGLPYLSLVRLISPNDPYSIPTSSGLGFIGRGRLDAEVATLYSAASVKSIPLHVARFSHPTSMNIIPSSATRSAYKHSVGNSLGTPFSSTHLDVAESSWPSSPRVEYEVRDLAAMATPLELEPDTVIEGEHGIVRSIILSDKFHALTVNTRGCIAVWDIARCICLGFYDQADVFSVLNSHPMDGTDSGDDYHSPRELLESVRERIEGECVISPWSTVDSRIGNLTINVLERCFETEIYADEAGYGPEKCYDTDQRLNVGKWVLSNLFDGFVYEELRKLHKIPSSSSRIFENSPVTAKVSSVYPYSPITSRSAVSIIITSASMVPAVIPEISSSPRRSTAMGAPLIPLGGTGTGGDLPPSTGTPTPRPRQTLETPTVFKANVSKEVDYFSMKPKRISGSGAPSTADDFSGWSGPASKPKDLDTSVQNVPNTPSSGGFMGRLRQLGKSSKRPSAEDAMGMANPATTHKTDQTKEHKNDASDVVEETEQIGFLKTLFAHSFHPPTAMDVPPLDLPPNTEIVLAEETALGQKTIYRGTVESTSKDVSLLEHAMPLWLLHYLLTNRSPAVPNIKISFGVAAWFDNVESSGPFSVAPTRLTANRYLRVRKVLAYIWDRIERPDSQTTSISGSISGATPRSSIDRTSTSSPGLHQRSATKLDVEASKKSRSEDVVAKPSAPSARPYVVKALKECYLLCMAYSPSKRARLSTSSSSSSSSATDLPNLTSNPTSQAEVSQTPSSFRPYESVFREENSNKLFKYEFPSQASLEAIQDNYANDDDGIQLTNEQNTRTHPPPQRHTTIQRVSHNLRRLSVRVVNFGLPDMDVRHSRLPHSTDVHRVSPENNAHPADLRGRTLGFLTPTNPVRLKMYNFLLLPYTEPFILLLIILNAVVLVIQSTRSIFLSTPPPQRKGYFQSWEDYILLSLFVLYSLEGFARICVNGFILDPETPITALSLTSLTRSIWYSLTERKSGHRFHAIVERIAKPFALKNSDVAPGFSGIEGKESHYRHSSLFYVRKPIPFVSVIQKERSLLKRGVPYLRHSWSRIDFVAILSFWIAFTLSSTKSERLVIQDATGATLLIRHIGLFRALSVLRCSRLLAVTNGTTTIMQSLKMAQPLLAQVAYFVLFAMILFSVIGVQSFKGSFRRECVLEFLDGVRSIPLGQQCGGHIDPLSLSTLGFTQSNGNSSGPYVKGFVCPIGQICQEQSINPSDNLQSYDNIFYAAVQVVIIASANTWAPTMYSMIDAEFFISSIFFVICIVVLNFWLINLFVAVITNTFQAIRSQTKKSAFGATQNGNDISDGASHWTIRESTEPRKTNLFRNVYQVTRLVWPMLAVASVGLAASKSANTGQDIIRVLDHAELGITIAFDAEIVWRFVAYLPDWRAFSSSLTNWIDLAIAISSSVIQIPTIHSSTAYSWLTIFQLIRWYRVILEVPRMRPLILTVFGNSSGLMNMTLFLLIMNGLASLVAVQLLRGDMDNSTNMNFSQIWLAFLSMYQILSSENWTDVMYTAAAAERPSAITWITVIFLSGWFLFGNFILIQLFIAVINENFDVAEEQKREQQVAEHLANAQTTAGRFAWISQLNPYKYAKSTPKPITVENIPSNLVLPMQKVVVQSKPSRESKLKSTKGGNEAAKLNIWRENLIPMIHRMFSGEPRIDNMPLSNLSSTGRQESMTQLSSQDEDEADHHLDMLANFNTDTVMAEDVDSTLQEQRARKADFIAAHPSYDKTFWVFSQKSPLRQFCQMLVEPPNGERIFGRPASPTVHALFQLSIFFAVMGGIVVAAISTPMYRREFYAKYGHIRAAWFTVAEVAFAFVLLLEFMIKIVADGFIFTPNAYLLSIWNLVDLIILSGLLINATTSLIFLGGLSRLTRSLKALRALRLITLFDKMRATFHSLLIVGFVRILDAGILAALYMIPYAVWGLNIFAGLSFRCNDEFSRGKSDCRNEYVSTVAALHGEYGFLSPRVWDNPNTSTKWSFDTFGDAILILFEIVSLEGWIDVMTAAIDITGRDKQPQTNRAQWNAVFFLIYNLLGAIVILTLFVSIIIANFSSRSGLALLTKPQREWIDLLKLIKRQRPSKRPKVRPTKGFRAWCFDRATSKHGYWTTSMTFLYVLHIIVLMTQTFSNNHFSDQTRDIFFLALSFVYTIDIGVRFTGLGWESFRANGWNLFDVVVVVGSVATTIPILSGSEGFMIQQLQKLFLVSIAFKLVQRNNSLNQLFKTSVSSLPVILSLLILWFALFLFFGILYVEVFGLTRWESAETHNENYTSLGRALIMLAFMSTGEGWNQYMHDFAVAYPRCTNSSLTDPDSDCGSTGWAFFLFITWNILSMYIFVNMFTGVVVESFSYVFQLAGGAKSVDREQMRAFKKVWAEYANQRTGYLERNNFVPFFGKLTGIFEVRVYPTEYQVNRLLEQSRILPGNNSPHVSHYAPEIDLNKLEVALRRIDTNWIRQRRALYNRLYHEARLSFGGGRGISFTNMLLMLAHNKLITDKEALSLKEFLARQDTMKMVLDAVNVDKVESLLKMIYHRRRFLRAMQERRSLYRNADVPNIIVEPLSVQMADVPEPTFVNSAIVLPASQLEQSMINDSRQSRRFSDLSMLSEEEYKRASREEDVTKHSTANMNNDNFLMTLENSPWTDLMVQTAEDD